MKALILVLGLLLIQDALSQVSLKYNQLNLGRETDETIKIEASLGQVNEPAIRYNHSTDKWQLTNDGSTWEDIILGKSGTFTDNCVLRSDNTTGIAQCGAYDIDDSGNLLGVDGISFSASLDTDLLLDVGTSTTKAVKPFTLLTDAQETTLEANTPPNWSLIVNTDTNKLKRFNSTSGIFEEISGSGSGAETVMVFETFEEPTDDWTAYDDGASSLPVDGTGGTTSVTCDQTAGGTLYGSGYLTVSKPASNVQGEGCAYTITPDGVFDYRTVEVSFEVFVDDLDYVDEDMGFYILESGTSNLVRFAGEEISTTNGVVFRYRAYPQLTSANTYKFVIHQKTTSALAYDLAIDNFTVKIPSVVASQNSGIYIEAYDNDTDSITALTEDIPFKTVVSNYNGAFSNAGNTGLNTADAFTAPFSAYYQIEGSILHTSAVTVVLGVYVNGAVRKSPAEKTLDGSNERVSFSDIQWLDKGDVLTFRSNQTISLQSNISAHYVKIKSLTPEMQEQNISTLATFHAYRNAALNHTALNTYVKVPLDTVVDDTLSGWDSGNSRYVVQKNAKYSITALGAFASISDTNASVCNIYKNGSTFISGTSDYHGAAGSSSTSVVATNVSLVKGDYLEMFCYQSDSATEAYLVGGQFVTFLSISEIAQPNVAIDTEKHIVTGAGNGATVLTANTTNIDFTEVSDSHAEWNGSVFTSKKFQTCIINGSVLFSAGVNVGIRAYVNGTYDGVAGFLNSSGTLYPINYIKKLAKGDTLSFRSSGAATLSNNTTEHKINIVCE